MGTKENTFNFIPVSPSSLPGWPGGLFFKIREAGTSVSSDFSSWKSRVSKFHLETMLKEMVLYYESERTVDWVEDDI